MDGVAAHGTLPPPLCASFDFPTDPAMGFLERTARTAPFRRKQSPLGGCVGRPSTPPSSATVPPEVFLAAPAGTFGQTRSPAQLVATDPLSLCFAHFSPFQPSPRTNSKPSNCTVPFQSIQSLCVPVSLLMPYNHGGVEPKESSSQVPKCRMKLSWQ